MAPWTQTLLIALGSGALATGLGVVMSLFTRDRSHGLQAGAVFFLSSFVFVPTYAIAGGWSAGFGWAGWWPLSQVTAARSPWLGLLAVIWIQGMALTPIAHWILSFGLLYGNVTEESMAMLEGGSTARFQRAIWPAWRSWVVATFGFTAAATSTDMVVTNLFQVTTLTERCYLDLTAGEWRWQHAFVAYAFSFSAALLTVVWMRSMLAAVERRTGTLDRGSIRSFHRWGSLAKGVGGLLIAALVVGVPLGNLIQQSGLVIRDQADGSIERRWEVGELVRRPIQATVLYAEEIGWSFQLACWSSVLAMAAGGVLLTMVHLARARSGLSTSLLVLLPVMIGIFALPGPVVNHLVSGWLRCPVPGWRWLADHTLLGPILCLQFRLLPIAYLVLAFTWQRWWVRHHLVWRTEARREPWGRLKFVVLSMSRTTPVLFLLLFALGIGELSSYIVTLPPGVTPISMRVFDLFHYGVRGAEAGLLLSLVLGSASIGILWRRLLR